MHANFNNCKLTPENGGFIDAKLRLLQEFGGFFHKTAVMLVGRKIRMDMRISCALVWLSH